jgi:ribosomal protein L31
LQKLIFGREKNLGVHMSEYEGGTFRCKNCGKEFLTKSDADKHYEMNHSDEVTKAME